MIMNGKTRIKRYLRSVFGGILILTVLFLFIACPEPPEDSTESSPYKQEHIEWPSLADSPWPTFRHDPQGTGRFEGVGPTSTNFEILYEIDYGKNYGSISTGNYNNLIFSTSCDLICIDVEGNQLWKADMCEHLAGNDAEFHLAPVITSDSTVLVGSWDYYLYCFDENTGEKIWDFNVGHRINGTPVIDMDGSIYFSSESGTFCLNKDGTVKWQREDRITPLAISPNGKRIYGRKFYEIPLLAMDMNGNILWENDLFRTMNIVVDNDGNIYGTNVLEKTILSVNENGDLRWSISNDNISSEYEITGPDLIPPTLDVFGRINFIVLDSDYNSHLIRINVEGEIDQIIFLGMRDLGTALISDINGTTYVASFFGGDSTRKVIGIDNEGEVIMDVQNGDYGYYGSPAFSKEGYIVFLPSWNENPMKLRIYK